MKKLIIRNLLDGRVFGEGAIYEDSEVAELLKRNDYGKNQRWLRAEDMSDFEKSRTPLDSRIVKNDEGKEINEYLIPADFICEIIDLDKDINYQRSLVRQKRAAAYPDMKDFLDAQVKKSSENPEIVAAGIAQEKEYFEKCLAVKAEFKMPE